VPKVLAMEMGDEVRMPPGGEAEARRFYGQLLGLRETMKPLGERGVWFRVPPGEDAGATPLARRVAVQDAEGLFKVVPDPAFVPKSATGPVARFRVDKAEALRQALDKARFRHYDAPHVVGTRGFYAHDPFGNRIELRERPQG
jgi:catechol 2,3-dioxygenase-like lactoylglutathione lyase family enzyme